jgi:glycosyltransferase involved in cell wall biosynthesis
MTLKIYYWAPIISKIATVRAVINSAKSLKCNSQKFDCTLINSIGEFSPFSSELKKYKIKLNNFHKFDLKKFLPRNGYLFSRFSFLVIFILSFFKLKDMLQKEKPHYLIIHLITSLPLILNLIINFNTKIILRVSGLPKLNFFRKLLWKVAINKVHYVTCPTQETQNFLIKNKLVKKKKVMTLPDPVIDENYVKQKSVILKNKSNILKKKYGNFIFCAGRLTQQKNFSLIIKSFKSISLKENNLKLIIAGEGELKKKLTELIYKLELQKRVFLIGHKKNIYSYFKACKIFCLPSLWEDPGFVLIEAAFFKSNIVSSNCPNGPKDFFKNLNYKYNFLSDNLEELNHKLLKIILLKYKISGQNKKILFNRAIQYTSLSHFKNLKNLLIPN